MKRLPMILAVILISLLITSTVVMAAPSSDLSTCTGTYTVVAGDTLSLIAAKCGVTVADLQAINPNITNPNLIFVGQTINLTGTPTAVSTTTPSGTIPVTSTSTSTYTTVSGDTLQSVASKFGVSTETLVANNSAIQLASGQVLTISITSGTTVSGIPAGESHHGMYVALPGETLTTLATKFHTSVDYMLRYNPNITNPNQNVGGMVIILPSM